MSVGAVSSSLIGISAAQSQMDAAAAAAARSGVIGDSGGAGDVVDSITGAVGADLSQAVNLAMLRRAMDMQQSIIDVLA